MCVVSGITMFGLYSTTAGHYANKEWLPAYPVFFSVLRVELDYFSWHATSFANKMSRFKLDSHGALHAKSLVLA